MSNVATLTNLAAAIPYVGDGMAQAVEAIRPTLPPDVKLADSLSEYHSQVVDETGVQIKATAGKVHAIIAQSKGTAGWLLFYNNAAPTVGTTEADFVVPFTATSGHITAVALWGSGMGTAPMFATAIFVAATTTVEGA